MLNISRIKQSQRPKGVGVTHVISFAPLSVGYVERTPQGVLPFQMAIEGVSIHEIKMERPLENQEVNATYWYHS